MRQWGRHGGRRQAEAAGHLSRVGVLRGARRRRDARRPRGRGARDVLVVGVRGGARRDVRRERALPPLPVEERRPACLGETARPLDDLRLHCGHLHPVRAARVRGHDPVARPGHGVERSGPRAPAGARLDRLASLAERVRVPRRWVGRCACHPADPLGRRDRRCGAPDGRRRPLHPRRGHLRDPVAQPVPADARLPRDLPPPGRRRRRHAIRRRLVRGPVRWTESS